MFLFDPDTLDPSPPPSRLETLYRRLAALGLPRPWVRSQLLPGWWHDRLAEKPAQWERLMEHLARVLGQELAAVQDETLPLGWPEAPPVSLLLPTGTTPAQVDVATRIGAQALQLVTAGMTSEVRSLGTDGKALRDWFLTGRRARYVGLGNLVDVLWQHGIPVLHLPEFPGRKYEALVSLSGSRPGIVLSSNHRAPAWLLWHLARAVGLLGLAQAAGAPTAALTETGPLLVPTDAPGSIPAGEVEVMVRRFAWELLTGGQTLATAMPANAHRLAVFAHGAAHVERVDPGFFTLHWGAMRDEWPTAQAALRILYPRADAPAQIRDQAQERLAGVELAGDTREYLCRLMVGLTCDEYRDVA